MTTNASKREFADRIRRFVRTQQFQSNCWYYEENSPPKWLNSNLSVSSEPLWVLSFFVFQLFRPTIPSHIWQTPSILPQLPTHASRTMRNVRFWGLRSYGSPSGPLNVSRRNPAIFQRQTVKLRTSGHISHRLFMLRSQTLVLPTCILMGYMSGLFNVQFQCCSSFYSSRTAQVRWLPGHISACKKQTNSRIIIPSAQNCCKLTHEQLGNAQSTCAR